MKNTLIILGCVAALFAQAQDFHKWAPTPPMGWNSWDCYGPTVTEAEVKANADYMSANLKSYGWNYIIVDIRWYVDNDKAHGYNEKDPSFNIDAYGRYTPSPVRFPSAAGGKGFKPLADYLHAKGLKLGLHTMRGVPVIAVKRNLPILNTKVTAADIYSAQDQCKWLHDNYTIDSSKAGAQAYYDALFKLYASWNVDFVKIDDLTEPYHGAELAMIRKAIDRCGRPIVFSTSPGETPIGHALDVQSKANMWRTVGDFWDSWKQLKEHFAVFERWNTYRAPGAWPDGDMLPLGHIGIRAERGNDRMARFTHDEQYTLMTLWSIFRSPLFFGGDLPGNDSFTLSLLTNKAVLDVLKYSTNNRPLFNNDNLIAWTADDPRTGDRYLALFNARDTATPVPAPLTGLCTISDLWKNQTLGDFNISFAPVIPAHGAGLYRLSAAKGRASIRSPQPHATRGPQSDNEDGTYTNPIIWSDFPDNDVIRVDDTYYMVTTTMYIFPGVPLLKSKDLVNWEYCTNTIDRFKQNPAYDLVGGTRYGHGQWATSIRYHNGKFHLLFVTLDEGGYHLTADHPEGPWQLHKLPKAYYDAGLFYDDDGRIYIVHGYSKLSLTEVDENLAPITKDSLIVEKVQRKGLEGSHVYKINGYYYIYATYGGGDGYQVALRSKNIYGPYEEKVVLKDDMDLPGKGVHQGALIETQTGEWWSVIFQDRDGVGRVPTLQPVHWIDGWPMLGENGKAVLTYKKPNVGKTWPVTTLPTSDPFNDDHLGLQWGWNHNPDDTKWSLSERKGYLRLKTANITTDFTRARNTLTQRPFGPWSIGTISLETSHMRPGDIAGLGLIQLPYAFIAVENKHLVMVNNGRTIDSIPMPPGDHLYLRASVITTKDEATFSYSNDNKTFLPLGDTLHMKFNLKMFTGNKFALFNYSTIETGGYVDIDWFDMQTRQGPPIRPAAAASATTQGPPIRPTATIHPQPKTIQK
ncbi:MAG: family 43 glycosylhydrolase [Bacteroidetes bacterium]|nr:family 43 glycosylhydrolase [Bacteroidota bacterium]